MPLVDLCLFGKGKKEEQNLTEASSDGMQNANDAESMLTQDNDFVMKTIVSRTFGDHCDSAVMNILRDPNEVVVLVFPHDEAMDLQEGITLAEERCRCTTDNIDNNKPTENNDSTEGECGSGNAHRMKDNTKNQTPKKMTLVFIDATWKHAREMETKTDTAGEWPKSLIRVQMTPTAWRDKPNCSGINQRSNGNTEHDNSKVKAINHEEPTFVERRFQIRTPPSPDHLSTAECIAWMASRVEKKPEIYQNIMKSLDYMVEIWKGFAVTKVSKSKSLTGGSRVRGFTDGDGCIPGWDAMSQKKRKIKHN
ncbi:hypothetical protein ACHAXR_004663 [Thalassiosira sp. AJA248-18]